MLDWVNEHSFPYSVQLCMWDHIKINKSTIWCLCHREQQEAESEWAAVQTHWCPGNIQILRDSKSLLHIHPSGKTRACCDLVMLATLTLIIEPWIFEFLYFCLGPLCSVPGSAPFLSGSGQPDDCGDVTDRTGLSLLLLEDDRTAHAHIPNHP